MMPVHLSGEHDALEARRPHEERVMHLEPVEEGPPPLLRHPHVSARRPIDPSTSPLASVVIEALSSEPSEVRWSAPRASSERMEPALSGSHRAGGARMPALRVWTSDLLTAPGWSEVSLLQGADLCSAPPVCSLPEVAEAAVQQEAPARGLAAEAHEAFAVLERGASSWDEAYEAVDTLCELAHEGEVEALGGWIAARLPRCLPAVQIALLDRLMDAHVQLRSPELEAMLVRLLEGEDWDLMMTATMALDRCMGWSARQLDGWRPRVKETHRSSLDVYIRKMG